MPYCLHRRYLCSLKAGRAIGEMRYLSHTRSPHQSLMGWSSGTQQKDNKPGPPAKANLLPTFTIPYTYTCILHFPLQQRDSHFCHSKGLSKKVTASRGCMKTNSPNCLHYKFSKAQNRLLVLTLLPICQTPRPPASQTTGTFKKGGGSPLNKRETAILGETVCL